MTDDPRVSLLLRTRVGHGSWDGNKYCGHDVASELAGRDSLWSVISLAVGGPRLDAETSSIIDELAVCIISPDPRIWPLKMTRLASSYGDALVGQCVGYLGVTRSQVGGQTIGLAARSLVALDRRLGSDRSAAHIDRVTAEVMQGGRPLPGFGVPYRPQDERVLALRSCVERRKGSPGHYWRFVHELEDHLAATRPLPLNIGGAGAAVLLDLGFTADQVFLLAPLMLLPNYIANAAEGAKQRAPSLLRLPDDVLEYEGAPPRQSPRQRREE